jgi:hypothetical protein
MGGRFGRNTQLAKKYLLLLFAMAFFVLNGACVGRQVKPSHFYNPASPIRFPPPSDTWDRTFEDGSK